MMNSSQPMNYIHTEKHLVFEALLTGSFKALHKLELEPGDKLWKAPC